MKKLYCSHCKIEHPTPAIGSQNEYWRWQKNKNLIDGGYFVCKKWYAEYQLNYKRTPEGWARITYHTQRKSSKYRNHPMPDYTLNEFTQWAFAQSNFDTLYSRWVENEYEQALRPSADRINDYEPYTLGNLRLITFKENSVNGTRSEKAHKAYDRVNALQGMTVHQYTLAGEHIASYKSSHVAQKATGIDASSITKCCRGVSKTAGGFRWTR